MKRFAAKSTPALLGLTLGCLLLGGCSTLSKVPGMGKYVGEQGMFRDRKGDYLKAETIPRTKIPAGLDGQVIDDLLVIPELPADTKTQAFLDPPLPRPIEGKSDREVVIQRMDKRAWIVADASPSQVWPRIRDYWRKNNVVIAFENPTGGVMETGWFVLAGNAVTQEKFRVMVETGFQDNTSEIRLLQIEAPQATPVLRPLPFQAQSVNADTEYTVLTSMSQYLADVADLYQASSVSFLAGNISSAGKATLSKTPAGNEVLQLKAEYDRSWAALGRALRRSKVNIVAEDSGEGFFDLVYTPGEQNVEEEKGFFHNLWTLYGLIGSGDSRPSYRFRLQVLKAGNMVEVLASPLLPGKNADTQNAGNSLLELLRNTLA